MTHEWIGRWADLLVDYCLQVQAGETVVVAAEWEAAPLVEACYRALVLRRAHPLVRLDLPGLSEFFLRHASDAQLAHLPPVGLYEAETADARIRIAAESDTRELARIDPARQAVVDRARDPIRRAAGRKRWVLTQYPTAAYAADAAMDLADYETYVARAMFLDRPDPDAAWRELGRRQAGLVSYMSGVKTIRIEAEGTDLTLSVAGRTWINSDGRRNMPSGEIFSGPVEESPRGRLRCGFPVCRGGRELAGIELEFADGQVVSARAQRGRGLSLVDARARPGRPPAGRDRPGPEPGDRPVHRQHPLRREDRRDRPPGARPELPRDRRHERIGAALGPDHRHPQGRPAHRRRPGRDGGRPLARGLRRTR